MLSHRPLLEGEEGTDERGQPLLPPGAGAARPGVPRASACAPARTDMAAAALCGRGRGKRKRVELPDAAATEGGVKRDGVSDAARRVAAVGCAG